MSTNVLTEGRIGSTLLRFAIPFLMASLLQALYGAADLFVVGQFSGSASVSAVAIGSQVMQTITGIVLGISMGGTVLIGRCVGERNNKATANTIGTLAILFVVIAAILTPAMILSTDSAVVLMHTPKEAVLYTREYILICACGIPFIIGYNAVSGIFRGMGDSKTPVYFIAIACAINVVLDVVLVYGFDLGAKGAAFATIFSQGVSFLFALLYMMKRGFPFPFGIGNLKLDHKLVKFILIVGVPLALQDALVNISFLIITAIINTMGLVASASVGVVEKIIVFAMLPPSAFASAVATMTAQNMGASKPGRAKKALAWGIGYSLIFGISVCIYSQISPQVLTSIFSKDSQVIEMAALYLKSYSFDCILVSFVFCMNSYFSGCGKSVISMVHSLIATLLVRIPLSYALSRITGVTLYQIGFAAPTATTLSLVICMSYFIYESKKRNKVARTL